jgi:peptide/nickel transport system permease protein
MANRTVAVCLALLVVMVLLALIAPWIAPHDPNNIDLKASLQTPSTSHLLGTDHLGRDVLSRLLYGTTTSFSIAISVVVFSLVTGIALGGAAGYFGVFSDDMISRVIDLFLSFPSMIFALAIVGALGSSVINLILALSLVHWAGYARRAGNEKLAHETLP